MDLIQASQADKDAVSHTIILNENDLLQLKTIFYLLIKAVKFLKVILKYSINYLK